MAAISTRTAVISSVISFNIIDRPRFWRESPSSLRPSPPEDPRDPAARVLWSLVDNLSSLTSWSYLSRTSSSQGTVSNVSGVASGGGGFVAHAANNAVTRKGRVGLLVRDRRRSSSSTFHITCTRRSCSLCPDHCSRNCRSGRRGEAPDLARRRARRQVRHQTAPCPRLTETRSLSTSPTTPSATSRTTRSLRP